MTIDFQSHHISDHWMLDGDSLRYIGFSENHVSQFTHGGENYFIRLSPENHRTKDQIYSELHFINTLYAKGINVAKPVESIQGNLVEDIQIGQQNHWAVVFRGLNGGEFNYNQSDNPEVHFRKIGIMLGEIHSVSKAYKPPNELKRFLWKHDKTIKHVHLYLSSTEEVVLSKFSSLIDWMETLEVDKETFGLIHGDFGPTNYRLVGDSISAFDFDDSCYHWFAYEIAIVLYPHGWRKGASRLLKALLQGYSENMKAVIDKEQIEKFCEFRQIYMFLHQMRNLNGVDSQKFPPNWFASKRESIARGYKIND